MGRWALILTAWLGGLATAGGAPPETVHVLELPAGWRYAPAASPPALDTLPDEMQPVDLPHQQGTEPCGVYRLRVPVPAAWATRRLSLVVEARGATVWAWLNGQALGVRAQTALDVRLDASKAARPGAENELLVAVADTGTLDRAGLDACRLEGTAGIAVDRMAATTWVLEGSAIVEVSAVVGNHAVERFEGKLELALEPVTDDERRPVWRRGSDVRLDPGQSATVEQVYEIERPRLWRPDDPALYRLTATVMTRDNEVVATHIRRLGVHSVQAARGRWLVNGEWVRLGGVAFQQPGTTLLCPQAGQAEAMAALLERKPGLPTLLDACDERGVVVLLDAPARPAETLGWKESIGELIASCAGHPCVWGWNVAGEQDVLAATVARLREQTPRLPVGRPAPDWAEDAEGFDFVVSRYQTRAVRGDNDDYGRRMEDLKRDYPKTAVLCIDSIEPEAPGDLKSVADSVPRRRGEAARRHPISMLFFGTERDAALYGIIEDKLRSKHLNPPHHEARLDKETIVVKSRFEGHIESPAAQRLPCSSMIGHRLVWSAGDEAKPVAKGVIDLETIRTRPLEGGGVGGYRKEVEWRAKEPGDLDFRVELQSAAGRVVASHRATLSLKKLKDDKVELKVGPPRVEAPPPPPPTPQPGLAADALVLLDLAKLVNNDGISSQAAKKDGNLDLPRLKSGSTYPADQLPKAGDFAPAKLKTVRFRFPDHADGKPNNVACDGQRLDVPKGVYRRLWLLAAADTHDQEGTGSLAYEGGDEPFALRVTDWCGEPAFGEIEAVRCANRHTWDGQREAKVCRIWAIAVDLRDQPLQAIVLPRNPSIHVFAATLVRAAATEAVHVRALEGLFDNDGISWRANPTDGNFDLPGRRSGDSFIADLMPKAGAAVAVPGNPAVTFRFPDKDDRRRNNVVCDGQRLHLPEDQQAGWTAAWFLGACNDGAQRAAVTFQYEKGADGKGELRLADWCSKPAADEIDVLRTAARHLDDGSEEKIDCGLVAWRIPLDPTRKLLSITLPQEKRMHVFALTLTRSQLVSATSKERK